MIDVVLGALVLIVLTAVVISGPDYVERLESRIYQRRHGVRLPRAVARYGS